MQNLVYLDNSATTEPCAAAVRAVNDALTNRWGNPSSLHMLGILAEEILNNARAAAAGVLGCRDEEIFFTSGGTEANNLALIGAAMAAKRRGNKIVTTSVEHPSVLNALQFLEQNGFEVVYIKPEHDGTLDADKVIAAVDDKTVLVSIMLVNNETGCIFPVFQISEGIKRKGGHAILHSDCVQAFGKLPFCVETLGADLITASGHKIHGPKGVGFLYKSNRVNVKPIVYGGGQEKGLRSGTESVPLIAGLCGAIHELLIKQSLEKAADIYAYAVQKFQAEELPLNAASGLPYIINISVPGYRSETLLHFLEERQIYVSSGSACSKGKGSHVLNEMGLDRTRIDSALRISLSRYSEKSDIDALCAALRDARKTLRRTGRNQ